MRHSAAADEMPLADGCVLKPEPEPGFTLNLDPDPLIVKVGDQLIVFRDEYGTQGPQCVAMTSKRKRCVMTVQTPGSGYYWDELAVAVGAGGEVEVLVSDLPNERFIRQRCEQHIDSHQPDAAPPIWEMFDPARHADLIRGAARWTWTPTGIRLIRQDGREFVSETPAIDAAAESLFELLREARRLRSDPARTTALYRFFDAEGLLLYVGITDHLETRHMHHVAKSSWMEFAASSRIERFPTRDEAQCAEIKAIETERPLFNSQYADLDTPRRLVEYLIQHNRTDLLAPAVSRG